MKVFVQIKFKQIQCLKHLSDNILTDIVRSPLGNFCLTNLLEIEPFSSIQIDIVRSWNRLLPPTPDSRIEFTQMYPLQSIAIQQVRYKDVTNNFLVKNLLFILGYQILDTTLLLGKDFLMIINWPTLLICETLVLTFLFPIVYLDLFSQEFI